VDHAYGYKRALLVHLGRPSARGEVQRVAGWRSVLRTGGWTVSEISLASEVPPRPDDVVSRTGSYARGHAAIESVTWSARGLRRRIAAAKADLIVVVSVRAWLPEIADGPTPVVLDLVDRLSDNYRQRAQVATGVRRAALSTLAHQHARIERSLALLPAHVHVVCAGHAEAAGLGATWLPIFLTTMPTAVDTRHADHDAAFVGSLRYEPNIDALRLLAQSWPSDCSLLVAGADPPPEVVELAGRHGWTLMPDFANVEDVLSRARLTVAPLRIATGLQIKVLDAAARGMPQVVSAAAAAGFEPGFVDATPAEHVVETALRLLDDPSSLIPRAAERRTAVADSYLPSALAARLDELLTAELSAH
jgi:Glycosyl transferases group 1